MPRILALFVTMAVVGFAQAPNKCGDLAKLQITGAKLEITRAEMTGRPMASASPSRCRITGPGSICSKVEAREPTGAQAAGDRPALARGFALATSDTGHQSGNGAFDGSFMQDQQAAIDFEFVASGRLTVVAKQIVETYYDRPPAHSYYVGAPREAARRC